MSTLFITLLISHVVLGLTGLMASFWLTFLLIHPNTLPRKLRKVSIISFVSYVVSWISGGWYYWKYYGNNVKPLIIKGDYAWAHSIFMEAKEHVFLFLPFATFTLALIIWYKADSLSLESTLRRRLMFLSLCTTIIALIITLAGVLITGGAR